MSGAGKRYLIVNADDFGRNDGVNRAIARAHERGVVTSTSLLVDWPEAAAAVAYARHSDLSVGLHVDLGEWIFRDGHWAAIYTRPATDRAEVVAEVARQLDLFRSLMGRDPSHIDSHQHVHVHRAEPVRSVLLELAAGLTVPLRHHSRQIRYCGGFYGQADDRHPLPEAVSIEALIRIVRALPSGVTELCCHPDDGSGSERAVETETLCDPRVRAVLESEGIELISFAEVRVLGAGG